MRTYIGEVSPASGGLIEYVFHDDNRLWGDSNSVCRLIPNSKCDLSLAVATMLRLFPAPAWRTRVL